MGSTIWAVLGVTATVGFGIAGIYLYRSRRYPGRITFYKQTPIRLFDSIVKNLPELSVLYKDKPVSEGLVLLKGFLVNTGSKDIEGSMVEEKLRINLREGYKWITAKIVRTSPDLKATLAVEPDKIEFTTGLMRRNEYVLFEALAEALVPSKSQDADTRAPKLSDALQITHRIADTQRIGMQRFSEPPEKPKKWWWFAWPDIVLTIVLLGGAVLIGLLPIGREIRFLVPTEKSRNVEVRLEPRRDGMVEVKAMEGDYEEILQPEEFFQKSGIKPVVRQFPSDTMATMVKVVSISIFSLLWLFYFARSYAQRRRALKVYEVLHPPE